MIRRIEHTGYTVQDIDRSVDFYCGLLGMELVARRDHRLEYLDAIVGYPGVHMRFAWLRPPSDDHVLELIEYLTPRGDCLDVSERYRPGSHHICVAVDDIWTEYRRLADRGVRFVSEPVLVTDGVNKGALAAYLLDPDGIPCELFQGPE